MDIKKSLGVLRSRKGPPLSKADLARSLLSEGYSANEISKAVPMAYSQVHQLNQKRAQHLQVVQVGKAGVGKTYIKPEPQPWVDPKFGKRKPTKPVKSPLVNRNRVGKLRTPGLSSDIDVGECANCGHDLVVRGLPTGFVIIHTNISAEEHLAVTQFCMGVPKVLLP